MMHLEEIIEKMKGLSIEKVAKEIGMSRQGLHKIVNGQSKPSYASIMALSNFFQKDKNNCK